MLSSNEPGEAAEAFELAMSRPDLLPGEVTYIMECRKVRRGAVEIAEMIRAGGLLATLDPKILRDFERGVEILGDRRTEVDCPMFSKDMLVEAHLCVTRAAEEIIAVH